MTKQDGRLTNKRGVLVMHPGAVGDVLLARPSLSLIRRQFPRHRLGLLAGSALGMLLREGAEIDQMFPLESYYLGELFGGCDSLHLAFKNWLRTCDCAVGWLQDEEGAIANTLRALGIPRVCVQSPFSSDLKSEHQASRYLEVLEGVPVSEVTTEPLILSSRLRERGKQLLEALNWSHQQRLVILHPGSGSIHKCLDATRFAAVVEWLYREGVFTLLIEGPSDGEAVANLQRALSVSVPILRHMELSTAAAVLSHADVYLGHDSGLTHLAAALSIPTVACFGPTSPQRWAPLGRSVVILGGAICSCPNWSSVERCRDKVCLRISPACIIEVCRELLMKHTTVADA
jgi:heptosyltransferase-3